jgi:predicted ATPase
LPAPPLTSFVGREQEVVQVRSLLAPNRLVTLVGAGGIGKTRLALKLAGDVRDDYPDGVWFVDLAPLSDPALVPQALASALGAAERPGQPILTVLVAMLETRQLLLILDNCEHLLDGCAQLAQSLLEKCPGVRILATSREALGLAAELIWRVPPLPSSDSQCALTLAELSDYAAVRLFVERARLVQCV